MANQRRVFIKTFGCQMNVYDSERMADLLRPAGFAPADHMAAADMIVLNTCHIREKAAEKVYSELGRVRAHKDRRRAEGKRTIVAVAGCVAQAEGREITRRAPVVDLVLGPQSIHRMADLVARLDAGERPIIETDFPEEDKFAHLPARPARRAPTAFLTIQEGCDKFCTFCVVPYTRGAEQSRPLGAVLEEAERLVAGGVREITLLGQNVNAWHGAGRDGGPATLADLIAALARIPGLARIRYTTSHPRDMDAGLIHAHGAIDKLMPYLHLPLQSGSDRILAAMNRRHTAQDYLDIVERLRAVRPDIALSTDIIVGFPGESDADFRATMDVVEAVGFAQAYSFKYSARPGTPAAALDNQVPEPVKAERLAALQAVLKAQQARFNAACVGRTLPVLFEKPGRREGQIVGRSPYLQAVHASADEGLIGRIAAVEIASCDPNSLGGTIVDAAIKQAPAPAMEGALVR